MSKEIEEGNKLITFFDKGNYNGWSVAEYHSSWEWIMPACIKFVSIEDFDTKNNGIFNRNPSFAQRCSELRIAVGSLDIKIAINQLVKNITWYNNLKKQQP